MILKTGTYYLNVHLNIYLLCARAVCRIKIYGKKKNNPFTDMTFNTNVFPKSHFWDLNFMTVAPKQTSSKIKQKMRQRRGNIVMIVIAV